MTATTRQAGVWALGVGLLYASALLALAAPAVASADAFNGRIAFASVRSDPQGESFDVFSMNPDGTGVRRLTTTVADQASSQPSWLPGGRGLLFRRSGPTSRVGSIWQMGPLGENPVLRFSPPAPPLYPSFAPDRRRVLYSADPLPHRRHGPRNLHPERRWRRPDPLFDVAGAWDSAPARSPAGDPSAADGCALRGHRPQRPRPVRPAARRARAELRAGASARAPLGAGRPPAPHRGYAATVTDFGATRRVGLRAGQGGGRRLVAFLLQRAGR